MYKKYTITIKNHHPAYKKYIQLQQKNHHPSMKNIYYYNKKSSPRV
jgi:hypothetical protein